MAPLDRPKLRPLSVQRFEHRGRAFALLEDPLRLFTDPVLIPIETYLGVVRHFDGRSTVAEIQSRWVRDSGTTVDLTDLTDLIDQLDRALVLDGPAFAAFHESYRREAVRPPALAGLSYEPSEPALRAQLDRYFRHPRGSGVPTGHPNGTSGRLRAVLSPHIDFHRGGPVYTWAYRELVERSDAEVFVILGVAHQYCRHRFALTRKDFGTPLGVVSTARDYVDRLAEQGGAHYFDDELAHRTEHSVEFQAVFLQHLLGDRRPFQIVPVLVGSFHDLMDARTDPIAAADVRRFVAALRDAEAWSGRKVAYIGGIDLCHVGPEFGDPEPVDAARLDQVGRFDRSMLDRAEAADPAGWFRTAAAVDNQYRVCGLAATYTLLHAIGPARGRLLRYDQAVDAPRQCCVTFASVAFDAPDGPEARLD